VNRAQYTAQAPDKTIIKPTNSDDYVALLLILFIGSGCAALIYEVVWFQLLRFVIGSTAISLSILLTCFMGGLFLGSLLFHRYISIKNHPLRIYAWLEFGIAVFGIIIPILLPQIARVYTSFAEHGYLNISLRALISVACLLPPTVLMGATLPAISRWMKMTPTGISRVGLFYSANIAGSVIGVLVAGFVLLRLYDVTVTTSFAVTLNIIIGLIALFIASRKPYGVVTGTIKATPASMSPKLVYLSIALSGLTALGAQVVWMRNLSLLFGATVYTFSIILTVFLIGLGIGSFLGAWIPRKLRSPAIAFVIFQLLLVVFIAYAGLSIIYIIPDLHFVAENQGWILNSIDDLLRGSVALLPATILWGASFPVALAMTGLGQSDPGEPVGRVYAANTAGAIVGVLVISLIIIPMYGTQAAQQLLAWASVIAALLILIPLLLTHVSFAIDETHRQLKKRSIIFFVCASVVILGFVASSRIPIPNSGMIGYGRSVNIWKFPEEYLYTREGINSSIAVSRERNSRYLNFHISGKVVASNRPNDMRNQRILGHLPTLLHPQPKSILVIGFGAGVTAGSFVLYPSVERIVIVEIEPEVPLAAGKFFRVENYDVLNDRRTELITDDARHFVTTTKEKFDIITADPIHPWVKGAAALYTVEFFELLKSRLKPGGFVTQWVPLYETSEASVKSEIGTFFEAFPHATLWNTSDTPISSGRDIVMLGQEESAAINARSIQHRLDSSPAIKESLAAVKYDSALSILKTFTGQSDDITAWLNNVEINRDNNLRLEYLAGEALDDNAQNEIYYAITRKLSYPETVFSVSLSDERRLRDWFSLYARRPSG
jgi:spermidine synthase